MTVDYSCAATRTCTRQYMYMHMHPLCVTEDNSLDDRLYLFGDVSSAGDDDLRHSSDLEVNGAHSEVLLNQ